MLKRSPSWPFSARRSPWSPSRLPLPPRVAKTFVFCSDISYPPEEFVQGGKNRAPTSTSAPRSRSGSA